MSALVNAFSRWYFNKLTSRLQRLGLTYHDAIADSGVHEVAVSRLPPTMQAERARRMKRALDLSSKHVDIPEAQMENPWREYKQVQHVFSETQKEFDERRHLNDQWWMPFHIGREVWHPYDTKSAWFWQGEKKPTPGKMH